MALLKVKEKKRAVAVRSLDSKLIYSDKAVIQVIHLLDQNHVKWGLPDSQLNNNHELSVAFLTSHALSRLHEHFLDDPSETDVITFPGNDSLMHAGDICVSAEAAYSYSKKHKIDFSEELTLYLVHGWLHLAGYNDLKPELKKVMRRAEAKAVALLRKNKAIPTFKLNRK